MGKQGKYDEQIRQMFSEGINYSDMARALGVDPRNLRKRCVAIGCEYPRQDRTAPIQKINESGLYEYIDGFVNSDSRVRVKCKTCGEIVSFNMVSFRHNGYKPECPRCAEIDREHREKIRECQKIAFREQRERHKRSKRHFEQITMKQCAVCGGLFLGRGKYCSKTCSNKPYWKNGEIRRRKLIAAQIIDKDITLEQLYKRDNGVCYLCGGKCDWSDSWVKNNVFIAGNNYPSIEHVKPLSKGGEHSWNNIRLAHRICNSLKSDNLPIS